MSLKRARGVSLLEFVLGLVVLAIVLVSVSLFMISQPQRLDAVFQFRAIALAEALSEQVLSAQYDGANQPGQQLRCGIDPEAEACRNAPYDPQEVVDGAPLGEHLHHFTAVDDFQLWCEEEYAPIEGAKLAAQLGLPSPELYQRFTVSVCVTLPAADAEGAAKFLKQVHLALTVAGSGTLAFDLYRYNIR